jgi:hypothetical protein
MAERAAKFLKRVRFFIKNSLGYEANRAMDSIVV